VGENENDDEENERARAGKLHPYLEGGPQLRTGTCRRGRHQNAHLAGRRRICQVERRKSKAGRTGVNRRTPLTPRRRAFSLRLTMPRPTNAITKLGFAFVARIDLR
jgi:hypothetical protein